MIKAIDLDKSYGQQLLLSQARFLINQKEKLALVGRNGHGKTTLFKMILGQEKYDHGQIEMPDGYTIGYLPQESLIGRQTVLKYVMSLANDKCRYDDWRAETLLTGLGFSRDTFYHQIDTLSGGWQIRLKLAGALMSQPDLLMLDEPTNFLDINTIRWLKDFLRNWPRECLVISHDASFLDGFIDGVLGIYNRQIYKINGLVNDYYNEIEQRNILYEKNRLKLEKIKKKNEIFIRQFRAKARSAGMVQSRIKMLDKQTELKPLERISSIRFNFPVGISHSNVVLEADNLQYGYHQLPLFNNLSFKLLKGESLGIIGANGTGKSTLMKVLLSQLKPWAGRVQIPKYLDFAYYAQGSAQELDVNKNVLQTVIDYGLKEEEARKLLAQLLFSETDLSKKVDVLSGGEKNRLRLGKVMAVKTNLLFLDEPTNHFDLESSLAYFYLSNEREKRKRSFLFRERADKQRVNTPRLASENLQSASGRL
jgi:ATP-binding cassette, subfamily F, member 3